MIHCKNPVDSWDWPINLLLTKDLSDWVAFGGGRCHARRQRVGLRVCEELGLHLDRQTVRNPQNGADGSNQSTGCATTQEEKFKYPHFVIFIVLFWTPVQSNLSDYTVP